MQVNPRADVHLRQFKVHKEQKERTEELARKAQGEYPKLRSVVQPLEVARGMAVQITIIEQVQMFGRATWSEAIRDPLLNDLLAGAIQEHMPMLLESVAERARLQYRTVLPHSGLVARQILNQVQEKSDPKQ